MASGCMSQLISVPVLSDIVVIFLSSIVALTHIGNFFSCASIAFSERYRDNSLAVVVRKPELYRLLTFHVQSLVHIGFQ